MEDYFSQIEAYLDGQLTGDVLLEFEQELSINTELQKEVEDLKVLRNDFAWLSAAKSVEYAHHYRAQLRQKQLRRLKFLIATLGLILVGLFAFWAVPKIWKEKEVRPIEIAKEQRDEATPTPQVQDITKPSVTPTSREQIQQIKKEQKPSTSGPFAGNTALDPSAPRMRSLATEEISESEYVHFEEQFRDFSPIVTATGNWSRPIQFLQSQQGERAHQLLSGLPKTDTTDYLLSVSELLLKRPSAAEELLYPLLTKPEWKSEAQYLLVWVYLLQDKRELARASTKVLADDYRNVKAIKAYLVE